MKLLSLVICLDGAAAATTEGKAHENPVTKSFMSDDDISLIQTQAKVNATIQPVGTIRSEDDIGLIQTQTQANLTMQVAGDCSQNFDKDWDPNKNGEKKHFCDASTGCKGQDPRDLGSKYRCPKGMKCHGYDAGTKWGVCKPAPGQKLSKCDQLAKTVAEKSRSQSRSSGGRRRQDHYWVGEDQSNRQRGKERAADEGCVWAGYVGVCERDDGNQCCLPDESLPTITICRKEFPTWGFNAYDINCKDGDCDVS
jgi:hypothetical protein